MACLEGHARDQALLLPASVEDHVAADSPVRFIDAFIDDLDLGDAGFQQSRPKATGRPGYDPADLLKLYLYGYLNRGAVKPALGRGDDAQFELIWLLRGVRPDFGPSPTFVAIAGLRSRRYSAPSSCCAAISTCSDASCWRWTARS